MIFKAIRQLKEAGVLGINRRNAEFIMRCNPRSGFPLVDDKILTKRLAEKHHIPIPPLYHVIEHHGDIAGLKKSLDGKRNFVIKPARGAGGSGIVLITDWTKEGYLNQNGEVISWANITYHISDILSGIYSLSGLEDKAIFEALIYPNPVFSSVTYEGIPDIRIIVYHGVPVMGMVRLPTIASDGKANLHRGAVGAGIDIGNGKTLKGVFHSEVIAYHPDTGLPVSGIQIPFWEKILLMAASSLDMTGLCYLGVDILIDRKLGPLLLELNARPGLAIQLANLHGLQRRLERVDKASSDIFASPETRVAWATETFTD